MVRELSAELIEYLVELGASDHYEGCDDLFNRFPSARSGAFMRLAPQSWRNATDFLDTSQLGAPIAQPITEFTNRLDVQSPYGDTASPAS